MKMPSKKKTQNAPLLTGEHLFQQVLRFLQLLAKRLGQKNDQETHEETLWWTNNPKTLRKIIQNHPKCCLDKKTQKPSKSQPFQELI